MQEFIKMPFWINGWEDIESNNFNNFKNIIEAQEEDKIDLKYLRSYYLANQESFVDIVDELSLRGFEFYNIKPNNLLNKNRYESGEFIIADSNSKFVNIDYETFYIGGFLSRFKVESNEFFNYVPLEGFKVLNPKINIEEFKNELIKNGFKCYEYSLGSEKITIDKDYLIEEKDSCEKENDEFEEDLIEDHLTYIQGTNDIESMTAKKNNLFDFNNSSVENIQNYFWESTYFTVIKFLRLRGITSISEITNQTVIDYCKSRGAGVTKIESFKMKLIEIYQEERDILPINYDIFSIDFCLSTMVFEDVRKFFTDEVKITDMAQITEEDLDIASMQKGITTRKIELIKEEILKVSKIERKNVVKRKITILFEGYWYETLKNYKLKELASILNISFNEETDLTLEDINDKDLVELGVNNSKDKLMELSKIINGTKSLSEIFEGAVNHISDERVNKTLDCRYVDGETLASTGEMFGITRERVRQLQKNAEDKITKYLLSNNLIIALILENRGKNFCTLKNLSLYIQKGKEYYCTIFISNTDKIKVFKPLSLLYFENYDGIEEKFEGMIKELPEMFQLYDYLDNITEALLILGIEDPSLETIEELLINYKYNLHGEYVSKVKLTLFNILDEIFKTYVKEPLRIDEEGAKVVSDLARKHFNEVLDTSVRGIEARIRDNANILLCGKTTFVHIENYQFDKNSVIRAGNVLRETFKTQEVVNIGFVFDSNKDGFIESGIKNKLALYSLVQHYYGDSFKVGKGNTLDIYKDVDADVTKTEDQLIELIIKNGGRIKKEEIVRFFGWKESRVDNTISISNKIIRTGKLVTILENFNVSEREKCEIKNMLDKLMGICGFTSSTVMLNEMKFNTILGPFLSRNNITDYETLAPVIKNIFTNIKGHSNFIYKEDSEFKSIDDVVRNKFNNTFYRDEVRDFIYFYGYKDMMVSNVITNAIEDGIFVEISSDECVHSNCFNISADVIKKVIEYTKIAFGDATYLSLSDMKILRKELPIIDYRWNAHLIKSLVKNRGFRVIEKIYHNSKSDKIILVKEESEIASYDELICNVLVNEYKGNMHETKIYDYLADKGLVLKQENIFDKKIPHDLKVSGRIKIDEVGRVDIL